VEAPLMTKVSLPATANIPRVKPTLYHDTLFRSRLEARWAMLFDREQIAWHYEPQGFWVGNDVYIPDFWLPERGWFVEVKPDGGPFDKALLLSSMFPVLLLEGVPEAMDYEVRFLNEEPAHWRPSELSVQAARSARFEELIQQHRRYYY